MKRFNVEPRVEKKMKLPGMSQQWFGEELDQNLLYIEMLHRHFCLVTQRSLTTKQPHQSQKYVKKKKKVRKASYPEIEMKWNEMKRNLKKMK